MTFSELHIAMLTLAQRQRLRSDYSYYAGPRRAQIESVAHELAHAIDLKHPKATSTSIGLEVHVMTDRAADLHELRVQRIEVAALRQLGVRVDAMLLATNAEWRRGVDPPRAAVVGPLTRRERRAVTTFLRIVRAAHKECIHAH